jgi:antitoxin (DNA-binding transcriptional repressor) of toxin-antitoxin stability system
MKTVSATQAKNRFGQILEDASADLVLVARRGKASVALRPAAEARLCILSAYATGVLSRGVAMSRLGYTWYGQLTDAMSVTGLHIPIPEGAQHQMDQSLDAVFGHKRRKPRT